MTEAEKILRDIEGLKESIQRNGMDIASLPMTPETKTGIIENSIWCIKELTGLRERLGEIDA